MPAIQVRRLSKTFTTKRKTAGLRGSLNALLRPDLQMVEAVREISFDMDSSELLGFIGPNGAGKSTTIKILTGILFPSAGEAEVLGCVPWKQRRELAYHIGTVFGQRPQLWYHLPAIDTFYLFGKIYDLPDHQIRDRIALLVNSLAYPGELATRSALIVVFLWIFLQLWRTTYNAAGGASTISGLSLRETLWYLMLAETIVLSRPRLSSSVAEAVKDGSISYLLNKPYNFLLYQASIGLGSSIIQMIFNALAGGALVWLALGPPPGPRGWPLVFVAILVAWMIDFCLSAMIGLAAFVTEDVAAFEWIYSKFLLLLGGVLIPLDFFPPWLRGIAQALPFAYTIYGPARFFVQPDLARFASLFAGQLLWLAVLGLAVTLLYQKSVSWLTINGG